MTGILEIKGDNVLKNRRIYMKNPYEVYDMNVKVGDKLILEGEEYRVILFLRSDRYLFLDVDKVEN